MCGIRPLIVSSFGALLSLFFSLFPGGLRRGVAVGSESFSAAVVLGGFCLANLSLCVAIGTRRRGVALGRRAVRRGGNWCLACGMSNRCEQRRYTRAQRKLCIQQSGYELEVL